jgi:hypothetical protein
MDTRRPVSLLFAFILTVILLTGSSKLSRLSHASTVHRAPPAMWIFPSSTILARPSKMPDSGFPKTMKPSSRYRR